ncbi:MAG TPA: prolyl oligopeptidase family serine peptidase [Ktedonobacterales bacterium]|nr:prolyl oligopeptidase family serine peptidase [Ktedonobacterales bacterium]
MSQASNRTDSTDAGATQGATQGAPLQPSHPSGDATSTPPLWQQRFRAPDILYTQLAAQEPTRGLVASNQSGVIQLYAWDVPTGHLRRLTDKPEGLALGSLSPDGRYIYYLEDQHGNEIGHYVRVPFEGVTAHDPAIEDVTPSLPPYASAGLALSRAGNRLACITAGAQGFQLYCVDLAADGAPQGPRLLHASAHLLVGVSLSASGALLVVASTERNTSPTYTLLAFDAASGEQVGELAESAEASIEPCAFSPIAGDERLLASTNRTGDKRPLIWHPRTGERLDLALDTLEGEVVPVDWSPDAKSILLCQFVQATQRLLVYDLATHALTPLRTPAGSLFFFSGLGVYFAPDGEIIAQWQDATHPSQAIALDPRTGAQTRTVLAATREAPGHPWRSITFASTDGTLIQGWLSMPDGAGPFPTILETHGGPTAVATEVFAPRAQAWVDAGFAYLTINYRGSTTFGRAFERAIWGRLGEYEVEDMVAAREWLVEQGIARPDQVFLTGWSYGGYLSLLGLGKRPELWAGGMAGVAIADWAIQFEDSAETLRGVQVALFGGTPDQVPERYRMSSPMTYAEQVRAPVLIIQGRHDTRTPARPIELYEARMKALGKSIEVVWFEAGHLGPFAQVEQAIHFQELMLAFTQRLLTHGAGH